MADRGCTQTNGAEVLIPDQSLSPTAQELTTFSSVSHDHPTRQTVTTELSGGNSFPRTSGDQATAVAATGNSHNYYSPESSPDHVAIQMEHVTTELSGGNSFPLTSGDQATAVAATGNSHNYYSPESSPDHVAIQMEHDHDPMQSGGPISNTGTNSIADQFFQLVSNFLGLAFQAAVALLIFKLQQPKSDGTPSSFLFNMVVLTLICGFVLTLIGMLVRRAHLTAANISGRAGILSVAVGFFLVMGMYIPESFHWLLWTMAGILLLAFAYSIAAPH